MFVLLKGVDYLLIAKPDAINHSGIRRDCATPFSRCRLLVVLTEGRDLCSQRTWRADLKHVRSGNKVSVLLVHVREYATAESDSVL